MRQVYVVVKMQLGSPRMVGVFGDWDGCRAELVRLGQGSVVGPGPVSGYLWLPALPSEPGEHVMVFEEAVRGPAPEVRPDRLPVAGQSQRRPVDDPRDSYDEHVEDLREEREMRHDAED